MPSFLSSSPLVPDVDPLSDGCDKTGAFAASVVRQEGSYDNGGVVHELGDVFLQQTLQAWIVLVKRSRDSHLLKGNTA